MRRPVIPIFSLLLWGSAPGLWFAVETTFMAPSAIAAPKVVANAESEALVRQGLELRRQGKDQEALDHFNKAYASEKTARTLAQIGLAEQALGRWVEAESHVTSALAATAEPWIRKNRAVLTTALRAIQRHVGSLEVIGPVGAEVRVNDHTVGELPFSRPVRLPIGVAHIEVRKPGYLSTSRPVSITAGILTRESVSLPGAPPIAQSTAAPSSPSTTPSKPSAATGGALADPPSAERSQREAERFPSPNSDTSTPSADAPASDSDAVSSWHRPVAWAIAGGAVLGVAGGVAALVMRRSTLAEASQLECNIKDNGTVSPADPAFTSRCLGLANRGSTLGVATVVSFAVAGALAIGSVILFTTAPSSPPSGAVAIACAPSFSGVLSSPGAVCQIRF